MHMQEQSPRSGWIQSKRTTLVLLGFVAIGAFFLLTEHTAHFLGVLPFLIFLLCPLMMLFMHGGHAGHGGHSGHDGSDTQNQEQPTEGGKS
jgi:hypothetical protein